MIKTTTAAAISVSLLLLGGGSLHLINRSNHRTAAPPQASKETNPVSTGESSAFATTTPAISPSPENTAYLNRLEEAIQSERIGLAIVTSTDTDVVNEMERMPLAYTRATAGKSADG